MGRDVGRRERVGGVLLHSIACVITGGRQGSGGVSSISW
jgi:hypothetical protein